MSDRPDFGWLYGSGSSKDEHSADDPEPTRMIPTSPRSDENARRPGQDAGTDGGRSPLRAPLEQPPPARPARREEPVGPTGGRGGRDGGGQRFPVGRTIKILVLLWVVFMIAVPVWAWTNIDTVAAFPSGDRPADQPGTTYLLVGSDSRKGLTAAENKKLGTGGVGDVGQRTDTIMLLHTGKGPNLLLSIPRDSLVPIPGHGTSKINSAFAFGGPKLLVETIERSTGVRIDHYVEIGFGGFVNSVDAVGGVKICPTRRMDDRRANLHIKRGCQHVDGVTALGYARSRHATRYGDFDRAKHQREVVSAIGHEVKSPWTFLNPFRYVRVNKAATSSLKVSKGTGPLALGKFALAMTRVNGDSGLTCSIPVADQAIHWDRPKARALLKLVKEDRTGDIPKRLCTSTGLPGVRN